MKEKLTTRHVWLLNRQPTPEQVGLYAEAPKKRGFAASLTLTEAQEADLFEAVFMLALSQTFVESGANVPNVYLFVPPRLEGWATKQLRRIAVDVFAVCKAQMRGNPTHAATKAKHLGSLFKHVLVGSRMTGGTTAPDHWVAYGFEEGADVPKWLTDALLPVYPFLRDDTDE